MINFVIAKPSVEEREPHSLYIVQGDGTNASFYATDGENDIVTITDEQLIQAFMAKLKGESNGYAELDGNKVVPVEQLPSGSKPAEISSAISLAETALQSNINAKADANAVYEKSHVDSLQSALQGQIDAKQGGLANATDVAKIGDATFDGKPIILLTKTEW